MRAVEDGSGGKSPGQALTQLRPCCLRTRDDKGVRPLQLCHRFSQGPPRQQMPVAKGIGGVDQNEIEIPGGRVKQPGK